MFVAMSAAALMFAACGANDNDLYEYLDEPEQIIEEEQFYEQAEEVIEEVGETEEVAAIIDDRSLEERIDAYMATRADRMRGLALSVFTRDEMILQMQYGYADSEAGLAVDDDTVFAWGSVAKLFVYVSALQLYERGLLDLHADIFTYIPAEYFPNIVYPITMHQLMNHTAGFDDHTTFVNEFWLIMENMLNLNRDNIVSLEEALIEFSGQDFMTNRPPGQRTVYSNYGIALAGYVIQRISGMPFHQYVHENIFAPLGMHHTAVFTDLSDNTWVQGRREDIKTYGMWGPLFTQDHRPYPLYPIGSAPVGTIADMIIFARALMADENGGSALFENAETLALLHPTTEEILNAPRLENNPEMTFFNGVKVFPSRVHDSDNPRVIGHQGAFIGFRTLLFIDIDNSIGMVMIENTGDGLFMAPGFLEFFIHDIPGLVK